MGKIESQVIDGKAKPRGKYPHIKRAGRLSDRVGNEFSAG